MRRENFERDEVGNCVVDHGDGVNSGDGGCGKRSGGGVVLFFYDGEDIIGVFYPPLMPRLGASVASVGRGGVGSSVEGRVEGGNFGGGERGGGGGNGGMGGGRSFSGRYIFGRGEGSDFDGSGGECGRGDEIGFGSGMECTECGGGSGGVGVATGCRRYVRCGRVMGGVIVGGGHGVGGGQGVVGVKNNSRVVS